MYDATKILTGLLVFLTVISFPIWYNLKAKSVERPKLAKARGDHCIRPGEYMRTNHMHLLDEWRDSVAREGERVYQTLGGQKYFMSLSQTCLSCHSKSRFCDRCHDYAGVATPYCWDCHVDPEKDGVDLDKGKF